MTKVKSHRLIISVMDNSLQEDDGPKMTAALTKMSPLLLEPTVDVVVNPADGKSVLVIFRWKADQSIPNATGGWFPMVMYAYAALDKHVEAEQVVDLRFLTDWSTSEHPGT